MPHVKNLVLGAGLSGLSASYHLGHSETVLLEAASHPFGIVNSHMENGFTWDNGPHVSFTDHEYVKDIFSRSCNGNFRTLTAIVGNYYYGNWIAHPAQTNLRDVPEPLRSRCLNDFLDSRNQDASLVPLNYYEWLRIAFGKVFTDEFPGKYTHKYWTVSASEMATGWVGKRVFCPNADEVIKGAGDGQRVGYHYIKTIRYPVSGGYQSFVKLLEEGSDVRLNSEASEVDLVRKIVRTRDGQVWSYNRLISTIPLPEFVNRCIQSTHDMKEAASGLLCTEALLVNVEAPHPARRPEHWLYIYDEGMLSTRINFIEKLSATNAPAGMSGIQVEVYASRLKPFSVDDQEMGARVAGELERMGLLDDALDPQVRIHTKRLPYANVAFLTDTEARLKTIWAGLTPYGLNREADDTHPMTDWLNKSDKLGSLIMAGRFGQWKYFWSDDCLMRGKFIAESVEDKMT